MSRPRARWLGWLVAVWTVAVVLPAGAADAPSTSPPTTADKRAPAPASKSAPAAKSGAAAAKRKPATAPAAVTEAISGPQVREFQAFCDGWMQKLRDRETYNTSHIAWETHDGQVSGELVGYGTDCTCVAREEPGKDPIGKITYRETRYRRQGATPTDALSAPSTVIEQSDVTEIFHFAKGRWQY